MSSLRRTLGPLSALLAFEAAARRASFTLAAEELGVTQAAVSKQIAGLEADLGVALFRRLNRGVRLTPQGEILAEVTGSSLQAMADCLEGLRQAPRAAPVTLAISISMSQLWLTPMLPRLKAAHPDLAIRILARDDAAPLTEGEVDMALRYGHGNWTDGAVIELFTTSIYPVASPGFLERHPGLTLAEAMQRRLLISYATPDASWIGWRKWLAATGHRIPWVEPVLQFSHLTDALQAARLDQGVLLIWGGLTGGLEESGALLRLGSDEMPAPEKYYLVRRGRSPEARLFADWLLSEVGRG